jgi:hypothetical protein
MITVTNYPVTFSEGKGLTTKALLDVHLRSEILIAQRQKQRASASWKADATELLHASLHERLYGDIYKDVAALRKLMSKTTPLAVIYSVNQLIANLKLQ